MEVMQVCACVWAFEDLFGIGGTQILMDGAEVCGIFILM